MDGRYLCLQPQHLPRPFELIGDVEQEYACHLQAKMPEDGRLGLWRTPV